MRFARSTPSAHGIDARGILDLLEGARTDGLEVHSLMLAHAGEVVAEGWWTPYAADRRHLLYSLSKSFTATAVGVLVDDGRVALDAPVIEYFPWVDPATVDPVWRAVTVRHCLSMRTGHTDDAVTGLELAAPEGTGAPESSDRDPAVDAILRRPPQAEPGSVFTYNQDATYLAASVVRAVTGQSLLDVLADRVFPPLGIDGDTAWHRTATGRELGFSGLHARTEDILALGQTYLDRGLFDGYRVLSPAWVAAAVPHGHTPDGTGDPDWSCGYGLSFWGQRHGYRGDGAFGQFMIVLPEHDAVLAITAEVEHMQPVLDLVWRHLLPAFGHTGTPAADAELALHLATLTHPPRTGVTGRDGHWTLADSVWAGCPVTVRTDGLLTIATADGCAVTSAIGAGQWAESTWRGLDRTLAVVASGGWQPDGSYAADLRLIETPHRLRFRAGPGTRTASLTWRLEPLTGPHPLALGLPASATE